MATITLTNPDGSPLSLSVEAFQAVSAQGGSTIVSVRNLGGPIVQLPVRESAAEVRKRVANARVREA